MENMLQKNETNKRLLYIDALNILACFGVVALHCTGKVFVFDTSKEWFFSAFLQALFHYAVPVFFMITGVTLMNYREKYTTKEFFKRRFFRTAVPFLIWSCVMLIYKLAIGGLQAPVGPRSFLNLFLNNEIQYIYWFFYTILGVYVAMPLISLLAKKEYLKTIKYYLIVFFIIRAVFPLLRLGGIRISEYFEVPGIAGYFGYVLMGWYLHTVTLKKRTRILFYAGGILSVVLMFAGTYFLSRNAGSIYMLLMDYTSAGTMISACALFIFIKNIKWKESSSRVLKLFSKASLGIYILQMFPINEIYRHYPSLCTIPFIIAETGAVYFLCFAVVAAVQKVPGLRKVFP